jgi:hypothetical protein
MWSYNPSNKFSNHLINLNLFFYFFFLVTRNSQNKIELFKKMKMPKKSNTGILLLWSCLGLSCINRHVHGKFDPITTSAKVLQDNDGSTFYSGIRRSSSSNQKVSRMEQARKLQLGNDTVVNFNLYNAVTDVKIANLTNGTVINLFSLNIDSPKALNVEAIVVGSTKPGSVKFSLDVTLYNRIEGGAPYSLCGNIGMDFKNCTQLTLGTHTVAAIPYSGKTATGQILGSNYAVTFDIVNIAPTSPTTSAPTNMPISSQAPVNQPTNPPTPTFQPIQPTTTQPTSAPIASNCSIPKVCLLFSRNDGRTGFCLTLNNDSIFILACWQLARMGAVPDPYSRKYGCPGWVRFFRYIRIFRKFYHLNKKGIWL